MIERLTLASCFGVAIALASGSGFAAPHAAPKAIDASKAACASAYEASQEERIKKSLRAAREHLVICGATTCASAMQRECIGWLAEVDAAMPTVSVRAWLGDREITEVRVLVDGREVAAALDGGAIALDPGPHAFRFEHAGDAPIEEPHVVVEGRKLAPIEVHFGAPASAPTAARPLWPVWIALGVSAAGLASFAAFGSAGLVQYEHLHSTCAPNCPKGDSGDVSTRFTVADVSLGVGLVAAGTAAILFVVRPAASTAPTNAVGTAGLRFDVGPAPSGAALRLRGSF